MSNFKVLRVMFCVLALSLILVLTEDIPKYTTKYDNVNIDDVLRNERLLKNYVNCLLDKGPCTPDGQELKDNMPDALNTGCSKCSESQKVASKKIIQYLIDQKPDYWEQLEAKYDPEGNYRAKYQDALSKIETGSDEEDNSNQN